MHEADGRGHRPSLGVKYVDAEQRTVVRCFAGCDNEQVMESLGLGVRDMFDTLPERSGQGRGRRANRPRPRALSPADRALAAAGLPSTQPKKPDLGRQTGPWRKVAAYEYVRADGSVAGEVIRREAAFERGRDKDFRQSHWDRQSGRMEFGGFEPIPYRLPQVLDTIAAGGVVYICEGEKDVAAAESAGLCATTNAGGATSWSPEHAKWLSGAGTVVIVADYDTAGYRRAERVMATLSGLVERVRVVRAATGKDLHDHLQCGHEIAELVPIPHLDPHTPAVEIAAASSTSSPAAEATVSAAASTPLEGDPMAEYMLAPSTDTPTPHSDEVDHAGAQMAAIWRLLVGQLLAFAQKRAEQRRRDAEELARRSAAEQAEIAERLAAERKAAEAKLAAMGKRGWDKASREELADAISQARAWAPDSAAAAEAFADLRTHLHRRFGVRIDPRTDEVDIDPAAGELIVHLADIERGRAADARLDLARDRMVQTVAGLGDLDESAKQALYADIQAWKTNPSARQLDALTEKLTAAKVPEQVRTRIRFTAAYLYDAGAELSPGEQAERGWRASTLHATHLLRQTDTPLVDPGEEAKPRIDALLTSYQDRLRTGANTDLVREKLSRAVALLTEEDRALARERGQAIRQDPAGKFAPLWPKHVDRDELTVTVNTYASLRPQADRAAVAAGDYSTREAVGLRTMADKQRATILKAAREGEGLHPLERDQLTALVRDIDAGRAR
ncbi:MAG TPA: toprim domain-containing protein, partial [Nocardia sp.]|uniref:toprim domain-containing protein n=1 Tax=Nocardia sp. TaxID=1821 RepID=UPI002B4B208C